LDDAVALLFGDGHGWFLERAEVMPHQLGACAGDGARARCSRRERG
jgi:hypothetical protein